MSELVIEGAAEHNLKGFDITIPKQKIIAITGVSGSGKSSLALEGKSKRDYWSFTHIGSKTTSNPI